MQIQSELRCQKNSKTKNTSGWGLVFERQNRSDSSTHPMVTRLDRRQPNPKHLSPKSKNSKFIKWFSELRLTF